MQIAISLTPETFILAFIFFQALLKLVSPLAVLAHELGHALPAMLLSSSPVTVFIGDPRHSKVRQCVGRFHFAFTRQQSGFGFCQFGKTQLSPFSQIIIAVAGPLASLIFTILFLLPLVGVVDLPIHLAFLSAVCFYAHLKLFLSSALPFTSESRGKILASDGLDIMRLMVQIYHNSKNKRHLHDKKLSPAS